MLFKILLVASAGALGATSRYGLTILIAKAAGSPTVWATFAVNILGCLLFGLVFAFTETRLEIEENLRLFLLVGFFGSFTTFSTFAFQATELLRNSQWVTAASYMIAHNVLGICFIVLGLAIGKML